MQEVQQARGAGAGVQRVSLKSRRVSLKSRAAKARDGTMRARFKLHFAVNDWRRKGKAAPAPPHDRKPVLAAVLRRRRSTIAPLPEGDPMPPLPSRPPPALPPRPAASVAAEENQPEDDIATLATGGLSMDSPDGASSQMSQLTTPQSDRVPTSQAGEWTAPQASEQGGKPSFLEQLRRTSLSAFQRLLGAGDSDVVASNAEGSLGEDEDEAAPCAVEEMIPVASEEPATPSVACTRSPPPVVQGAQAPECVQSKPSTEAVAHNAKEEETAEAAPSCPRSSAAAPLVMKTLALESVGCEPSHKVVEVEEPGDLATQDSGPAQVEILDSSVASSSAASLLPSPSWSGVSPGTANLALTPLRTNATTDSMASFEANFWASD